ncbi:tudor domain-containing protein 1-like isoform X2 [Watersipora subatra]|uniref:tudor domain-containing protein 1-like isoform X2 n=1 Tax=Watersipora subatra TaxID=2589382 RepID=UPI00355BED3B
MELDNWNPMADAYNDKTFNTYDRGPGRNMSSCPLDRSNLYIRGVPQALNEEGIRNLFSKYGNIKSCRIRRTPNYNTNIAFVMMETVEQCSEAIHHLNGHKIGNDRLTIEFAKSSQEKEKDRLQKERQEELIKSLGSGRTVTNVGANHSSPEETPMSSKQCEQCGRDGSSFRCGRCQAPYCSQACQARNWPSHKHKCHSSKTPIAPADSRRTTSTPKVPPVSLTASPSSSTVFTKELSPIKSQQSAQVPAPASVTLPLKEAVKVKLVEFQSPAKFFVQLIDNIDLLRLQSTLNQAIECSLYGLKPYKGDTWTDFAVQACTRFGLNTGDLYTITCVNTSVGNQVMFTLPDGTDLGDNLVAATGALVDPNLKYTVWDSIHRHVSVGSVVSLCVEPSSIEGVDGFYAQVGNDDLKPYLIAFNELEAEMTEYGNAHVRERDTDDSRRLPEVGQHVLGLYEGCWSRAEVVLLAENNVNVGVAFLDYGNLQLVTNADVMDLPRQFSHFPAVAAKIHIDGVTNSLEESALPQAKTMLQSLLFSNNCKTVQAVVRDMSLDTLSVKITTADGADLGSALLSANFAVKQDEPLEDSIILARSQKNSTATVSDALSPPQPCIIQPQAGHNLKTSSQNSSPQSRSPAGKPAQAPCEKIVVSPLLSTGVTYVVTLRKLDGLSKFCVNFPREIPRNLESLSKQLSAFYSDSSLPDLQKPTVGDFAVFQRTPGVWLRGCIQRVSTANKVALIQQLDCDGETCKVTFDKLRPLLPRFAELPCQSIPVCQLEGVTDPDQKNAILKPFMQLPIELKVIGYEDGVYTVRVAHDGQPLGEASGEKHWMAGTDIPYVSVPKGPFQANILHVVSPLEMYFTPAIQKDIQLCLETIKEQSSLASERSPPTSVRVGEVVFVYCTLFEEWDRAIVLKSHAGNKLTVQSADYGSTYTETLSNVRSLDEASARIPLRAVECSLAGVEGTLTDAARQQVLKLDQKNVIIEVVDESNGLLVRITDPSGCDVGEAVSPFMLDSKPLEEKVAQSPSTQPGEVQSHADAHLAKLEAEIQSMQLKLHALMQEKARLQEEKDD